MCNLNLLEKLCLATGISGDETPVRNIILSEISPYVTDIKVDTLGNVIAFKKGNNPAKTKLMLSAHMDEVGFIVTHITDDGFVKFDTVGGIDSKVIYGKSVVFNNHKKTNGIIGAKPVHLLKGDEREKVILVSDMYIDIGATSRDEASLHVSPGDSICFEPTFQMLNDTIIGKSIDDRAGCFILCELIKQPLEFDTHFVFSVQEEIGTRGAKTATYQVNPQVSLVVEATTAADIPSVSPENQVCKVGAGPVVSFMDRSTIYDKELFALALSTSKEFSIKTQVKEAVSGGNDSGSIHVSRSGVRPLCISLACRYLHSAASLISYQDLLSSQKLIKILATIIAGGSF